ncbi:MAG: Fumarylacetoacetate hydrolase family protein [Myxococcaceae bacterium]|nr:Fumarylacetoacetate hydrolase family protein [Myxococcaceae bacterium]
MSAPPNDFVFAPPAVPSLAVEGAAGRFPVRRILCVGRNYAAHRREMGGDDRDPPVFFAKPGDAAVAADAAGSCGVVPYPSATGELHHEIELVVCLGRGGRDVPVERALELVFGYAVGVDLTRRDLQNKLKAKGHPWEAAKGFDASAPLGVVRPAVSGVAPQGRIWLAVNGDARQEARLDDMIWSVAETLAQASRLWALAPGDLVFTGTPEGVGPLVRGDRVTGGVDGVGVIAFTVG